MNIWSLLFDEREKSGIEMKSQEEGDIAIKEQGGRRWVRGWWNIKMESEYWEEGAKVQLHLEEQSRWPGEGGKIAEVKPKERTLVALEVRRRVPDGGSKVVDLVMEGTPGDKVIQAQSSDEEVVMERSPRRAIVQLGDEVVAGELVLGGDGEKVPATVILPQVLEEEGEFRVKIGVKPSVKKVVHTIVLPRK